MSQQRQPMYDDSGGGAGGDDDDDGHDDYGIQQSNFFFNRDGILNDDTELINDDDMFEYDDAKNDETFGDIEGGADHWEQSDISNTTQMMDQIFKQEIPREHMVHRGMEDHDDVELCVVAHV
jgi:hypothetical protein